MIRSNLMIRVIFLVSMFISRLALADQNETSFCYDEMSTVNIKECFDIEIESLEKHMKRALEKVLWEYEIYKKKAKNDPNFPTIVEFNAESSINKSQEYWLKYRDFHCMAIFDIEGSGTLRFIEFRECKYRMIKDRIIEIRNNYSIGKYDE